jgi:eight-cysteine-cluster-containing protein
MAKAKTKKKKAKPKRKKVLLKKKTKKTNLGLAVAFIAFLAIVIALALQQAPVPEEINSFDECAAAGYPIMESYPRQCAVPGGPTFTEIITDYYGSSTFGFCNTDTDCMVSGCNAEICQSRNEESLSSICIVPERPTPSQVGYECECLSSQCQWA